MRVLGGMESREAVRDGYVSLSSLALCGAVLLHGCFACFISW